MLMHQLSHKSAINLDSQHILGKRVGLSQGLGHEVAKAPEIRTQPRRERDRKPLFGPIDQLGWQQRAGDFSQEPFAGS
jgi:hypothetical protein